MNKLSLALSVPIEPRGYTLDVSIKCEKALRQEGYTVRNVHSLGDGRECVREEDLYTLHQVGGLVVACYDGRKPLRLDRGVLSHMATTMLAGKGVFLQGETLEQVASVEEARNLGLNPAEVVMMGSDGPELIRMVLGE
jgi:hypothetical protein